MNRRQFVGLLASVAAWPAAARAQSKLPVIGFMDYGSFPKDEILRGLSDNGFVRGRDFTDVDTWGEHRPDAMVRQAHYLVERGAALIIANTQAAVAANSAKLTVPIVFQLGVDPVAAGLVENLNRPGGNMTGVSMLQTAIIAKRLELLHELVPNAKAIAYLRNPTNEVVATSEVQELQAASRALGVHLIVVDASSWDKLEDAFTSIVAQGAGGLVVSGDLVYWMARSYIAYMASSHKVPAIYPYRQAVQSGSLMSFGVRNVDGWYAMGVYAARILKGEKPGELPVQQVTKTEFALNIKAARELGLSVPLALQVRADEVVE